MSAIAAIDVGSNAVRLVVATLAKNGSEPFEKIANHREAVRLGTEAFASGEISSKTSELLVEALTKFSKKAAENKVIHMRAVATAALREAKNGSNIVEIIKKKTGLALEIISGEEEAKLIFLAVNAEVDLSDHLALLIDIGGGSVEISVSQKSALIFNQSYHAGTIRLLQQISPSDDAADRLRTVVNQRLKSAQTQVLKVIGKRPFTLSVGTGGNFEAIGDLRKTLLAKGRKTVIRRSELVRIREKVEQLSLGERMESLGLKPDRADVILPACIIIEECMELFDINEVQIPRVGLKDGILADLVAKQSWR